MSTCTIFLSWEKIQMKQQFFVFPFASEKNAVDMRVQENLSLNHCVVMTKP